MRWARNVQHAFPVHEIFGDIARQVNTALARPWALPIALLLIVGYFVFGPTLGLPPQPLELGFLLTLATFVLVFLIEHEGHRDNAASQLKLDEIIRALDADRSKIGIEQKQPREIALARAALHAKEDGRKAG